MIDVNSLYYIMSSIPDINIYVLIKLGGIVKRWKECVYILEINYKNFQMSKIIIINPVFQQHMLSFPLHSLNWPTVPTVLAREEHIFVELNEFILRNCANGQNSQ